MDIAVRIEPFVGDAPAPPVEYRWDADTTILCATVAADAADAADAAAPAPRAVAEGEGGTGLEPGMSGSVEIEGRDGSWLVLDVAAGTVRGIEVAVWPELRHRSSLRPPAEAALARVVVPGRRAAAAGYAGAAASGERGARAAVATPADAVESLEVNTAIAAETDEAERTIHFILGPTRSVRRVRVARDLVLDVDDRSRLAGLWLLNVPPCPTDQ